MSNRRGPKGGTRRRGERAGASPMSRASLAASDQCRPSCRRSVAMSVETPVLNAVVRRRK